MRIRNENKQCCDVLVVGAGAAGLFAALAARGVLQADGTLREPAADAPHVVLLNNEARLGLKILASGGGRCNLTNAQVDAADYELYEVCCAACRPRRSVPFSNPVVAARTRNLSVRCSRRATRLVTCSTPSWVL